MDYLLVRSLAGGALRVANPWPDKTVAVASLTDGETSQIAGGELLEVATSAASDYLVQPAETVLETGCCISIPVCIR